MGQAIASPSALLKDLLLIISAGLHTFCSCSAYGSNARITKSPFSGT